MDRRAERSGHAPRRLSGARCRGWTAVPAALALAASPAVAAGPDWSKAQPLTIIAKNYEFEPSHLSLRAGTPYRIHIENRGTEAHEFNAAQLFKDAVIGDPKVLNADHTELIVQPGQEKDLLLLPKKAGKYPLICPDHDWAGMTGDITVE
jgi:uncharacterized cupredoxin-like copper-binding protein